MSKDESSMMSSLIPIYTHHFYVGVRLFKLQLWVLLCASFWLDLHVENYHHYYDPFKGSLPQSQPDNVRRDIKRI